MTITSTIFLFIFLPMALATYYIANSRIKEYVLLAESMLFYALGDIQFLGLFLIATLVVVTIGRSISFWSNRIIKLFLLVLGICANIGVLLFFKYSSFWGIEEMEIGYVLPLGLSFFTFKSISYLVDIYLGKAVVSKSVVHDALYLSFFTQIQAGPLTRYNDLNCEQKFDRDLFADGIYRFLIGFSKKILIADVLSKITNEVFSTPITSMSTGYAWLGSICYSLQLFFDFAGYSDMAIGLSQMFGYKCRENFNYPYMTESVSRFWRRWHISLSEWFRDYVYIPIGGSKVGKKWRLYFNLLVVWILTGIWHGGSWNFIAWGLGYFVAISFERITNLPAKIQTKWGKCLYRVLTLLFINFQWVLFRASGVKYGLQFIKRMILWKSFDISNSRTIFLLKEYSFFICIAIVLCFPVVSWIQSKLKERKSAYCVFEVIMVGLVVGASIWALSFVVSGLNNPFAYANF